MHFEQLYYLVEVAKTKSITLTSEQIHVSKSTIVSALKNLEKEIGVKLYSRDYHGIILSKQGEEAVEIAKTILKEKNKFKNLANVNVDENQELTGVLTIYCLPTINMTILSRLIPLFYKLNPKVIVSIFEKQTSEIINNVANSKEVIGLIAGIDEADLSKELAQQSSEVIYEKLLTDTCYMVASKEFQLSSKKSISLSKLIKYPLAVVDNPMSLKLLSNYGKPNIVCNTGNLKLFIEMVVKGLSVCMLTKQAFEVMFEDKELFDLVPIKEYFRYDTFLIHQKGALDSLLAVKFISFLKSALLTQSENE